MNALQSPVSSLQPLLLSSINDLSNLQGPIILVGGTFDGVHLGHQALILRAQEEAKKSAGRVVVMTFDQHPAAFLRPEQTPKVLTRTKEKIKLLRALGVDTVLLLPFNAALAATTAENFIHQLAAAAPGLKAICVGANWSFGQGGKGNLTLLRHLGETLNFSVITIDPIRVEEEMVSSTRIRNALASGDLNTATACLGYPYALVGTVVHGAGRGKGLGFPTANLDLDNVQLPPSGVYLAKASVNGTLYDALVNIGVRPTIHGENSKMTVEAYLLDVESDLYGQEIKLELTAFLREERTFTSPEALKAQILKDIEVASRSS
ncbi:MAG: bifunctional riboflavin kinase/FAD synthetase [Chthoniobacterales bacterium]